MNEPNIRLPPGASRLVLPSLQEPQLFLLLAILIGIFSGLAVV